MEQPREVQEHVRELPYLLALEAERKGHGAALKRLRAGGGVDAGAQNQFRRVGSHLLDLDAAFGGGHHHHPAAGAIHHRAEIELAGDGGRLLDEDAAHGLPGGIGLHGDQTLAQPAGGELAHRIEALHQLDAAGLAAPAGVNLHLAHPSVAAERFGGANRLAWRLRRGASGNRQPKSRNSVFAWYSCRFIVPIVPSYLRLGCLLTM